MVYFCADTVATDVSVQGECKIQCRRVLRHSLNFAFGGKHKYFRCKQVQLDGIEEVNGIRLGIIKYFFDGAQPFIQFAFIFAASAIFIFPVGGETLFGYVIHPFTADLYFNPLPVVSHKGDVQGLVTIGFGMTHPVAQTVGVGFVYFRDGDIDIKTIVQFFVRISWFKDNTYGK